MIAPHYSALKDNTPTQQEFYEDKLSTFHVSATRMKITKSFFLQTVEERCKIIKR